MRDVNLGLALGVEPLLLDAHGRGIALVELAVEGTRMRLAGHGDVVGDERAAGVAPQVQRGARSQDAAHHGGAGDGCAACVVEVPQHVARIRVDLADAGLLAALRVQDDLVGHGGGRTLAVNVDDQRARAVGGHVVDADGVAVARDIGQRQLDVRAAGTLRVGDLLIVHIGEVEGRPAQARTRGQRIGERYGLRLHIVYVDERRGAGIQILPDGRRELDLRRRGLRVRVIDDVVPVFIHREQAERVGVAAEHDGLLGEAGRAETGVRALVVLDIGERRVAIEVIEAAVGAEVLIARHVLRQHVAVHMAAGGIQRVERDQVEAAGDAERVARAVVAVVAIVVPNARRERVAAIDGGEVDVAVVPVRARRQLACRRRQARLLSGIRGGQGHLRRRR